MLCSVFMCASTKDKNSKSDFIQKFLFLKLIHGMKQSSEKMAILVTRNTIRKAKLVTFVLNTFGLKI